MPGYLLDTNVVSELRKRRPDANVTAFVAAAEDAELYLSALTIGELRRGVEAKRANESLFANQLGAWVDQLESTFVNRILSVDVAVARRWGELSAARTVPVIDTLIAATALVHGLTLVTRNSSDFQDTGAAVINPWISAQNL